MVRCDTPQGAPNRERYNGSVAPSGTRPPALIPLSLGPRSLLSSSSLLVHRFGLTVLAISAPGLHGYFRLYAPDHRFLDGAAFTEDSLAL